ncbi:uncharacterized protein LOC144325778 isoform X2 [Podarcis muralis]
MLDTLFFKAPANWLRSVLHVVVQAVTIRCLEQRRVNPDHHLPAPFAEGVPKADLGCCARTALRWRTGEALRAPELGGASLLRRLLALLGPKRWERKYHRARKSKGNTAWLSLKPFPLPPPFPPSVLLLFVWFVAIIAFAAKNDRNGVHLLHPRHRWHQHFAHAQGALPLAPEVAVGRKWSEGKRVECVCARMRVWLCTQHTDTQRPLFFALERVMRTKETREPRKPAGRGGGANMATAKAKRIKFSDEEKFLILEGFALRKDILIPKSGRYSNTVARQRAWEEIAAAVNSLNPLIQRTPQEILKKWKNMVVDARKGLSVEKHPLLQRQPRERLFRDIVALLNKTDPALPRPLLYSPGLRAESPGSPGGDASPTIHAEVLSGSPCLSYLHNDSHYWQPCRIEAPGNPKANGGSPQADLARQNLASLSQSGDDVERRGEDTRERGGKTSAEPCKGVPLSYVHHSDQPHCAQIPRMLLPQRGESGRSSVCRTPEPSTCSSDLPLSCKLECPLSHQLECPCLGTTCSPLIQNSSIGSSALNDHAEDLHPSQKGCSTPTRGPSKELLERQSQLQTEVLELQKETLQLQKEKILLEKEKLLLEILKLRRDLGT